MMRLYLTPVDDCLVLHDIQHFNAHLISALLQVHITFLKKGWTPVCKPGEHSPLRAEAEQEPHLNILCHRGSSQECLQTWQGTTGWGHGDTDFSNSVLALHMCIKQRLILTVHPLCQGKHQECQDLLGKPTITLGTTRTFITVSGAAIFSPDMDVPDPRLFPNHFLISA